MNKKNFEDEELPHELFLDAFANNMSADIKLSKVQVSRIIQSDGSFGSWLGNLENKH